MKKIENAKIQWLVKKLALEVHPEGGYFKQIYQSKDKVTLIADRYGKECRNSSTSIYYLLGSNDFSALHRIKSDELWNFCSGSPLTIHIIEKNGGLSSIIIGDPLITEGAQYQYCVEHGQWFCAKPNNPDDYTLVTCTVSPGFNYKDWELADRKQLISQYQEYEDFIEDFTRVKKTEEISSD